MGIITNLFVLRTQFRILLFIGVNLCICFESFRCYAQSISFGGTKYDYVNCKPFISDSIKDEILEKVPFGQPSLHEYVYSFTKEQYYVVLNFFDQCKNIVIVDAVFILNGEEYKIKENIDFIFNCAEMKIEITKMNALIDRGMIKIYWICQDIE